MKPEERGRVERVMGRLADRLHERYELTDKGRAALQGARAAEAEPPVTEGQADG